MNKETLQRAIIVKNKIDVIESFLSVTARHVSISIQMGNHYAFHMDSNVVGIDAFNLSYNCIKEVLKTELEKLKTEFENL